MGKHTDVISENFVSQMGLVFEAENMPRIAGHIFALLVIDGGPLSLHDMSERLEISRASASTNARLLENMGALERTARKGDRQAFYRLGENPYARMMQGMIQRMSKTKALVETTRTQLPDSRKDARRRLGDLEDFYTQTIDALVRINKG